MLAELLASLFPAGYTLAHGPHGTMHGEASIEGFGGVALIGLTQQTSLCAAGALLLAGHVLQALEAIDRMPILLLMDVGSQSMTRQDELLGLNEYLAHLAKTLQLAAQHGHRTVGFLYGHAAAGAFIATGLSTQVLLAAPDAHPCVMDLDSVARVTKLPLEKIAALAQSTPIFAPGLSPMLAVGAVYEVWDTAEPLSDRLKELLSRNVDGRDSRDELGLERNGRLMAARVAKWVEQDVINES
jgi:malonate decarboxylase gamma subunit